jgi:hypothetical protein
MIITELTISDAVIVAASDLRRLKPGSSKSQNTR